MIILTLLLSVLVSATILHLLANKLFGTATSFGSAIWAVILAFLLPIVVATLFMVLLGNGASFSSIFSGIGFFAIFAIALVASGVLAFKWALGIDLKTSVLLAIAFAAVNWVLGEVMELVGLGVW